MAGLGPDPLTHPVRLDRTRTTFVRGVAGRGRWCGPVRPPRPGPCPPTGCHTLAVGESGAWDAVWLPLPLLDDAGADLRGGAVDGLGALVDGGPRLWERHPVAWALTAHLAAGGDDVRRTRDAFAGLAQAVPAVRRLAGRTASGEVRAAALSLLDADDPCDDRARDDVRSFVEGLDDPREAVRCHAALGLTRWAAAGGKLPPGSCRRAAVERAPGRPGREPATPRDGCAGP